VVVPPPPPPASFFFSPLFYLVNCFNKTRAHTLFLSSPSSSSSSSSSSTSFSSLISQNDAQNQEGSYCRFQLPKR